MQSIPEKILIGIAARSESHQTWIGHVGETISSRIRDHLVHETKRIEIRRAFGKVRVQRLIERIAERRRRRISVVCRSQTQVRHAWNQDVCGSYALQRCHDCELVSNSLRNRSAGDE